MKRKRSGHDAQCKNKRGKLKDDSLEHPTVALLRQCYPHVLTLRQYLISRLPRSSKKRRRTIAQYGREQDNRRDNLHDDQVSYLLDNAVVGTQSDIRYAEPDDVSQDITVFTQQLSESTVVSDSTHGALKQSEIVDFVIWQLFRRHNGNHRPAHQLCHGYQRYCGGSNAAAPQPVPGVPGVFSTCDNPHVQVLKKHPWTALPGLLGKRAERIISGLLIDCAVFVPIEHGSNLSQISGKPMHEIRPAKLPQEKDRRISKPESSDTTKKRGLSDIRFVRHRMLYARPPLSNKGSVRFGLDHIHALNRGTALDNVSETVHLMKYVFPRQFGLHNVFTSDTDPKETAQAFRDYTLREKEISRDSYEWRQSRKKSANMVSAPDSSPPVPKRLRGHLITLFSRVRKRHARCHYHALLLHYCPTGVGLDNDNHHSTRLASSATRVSAFCRSALSSVFPTAFWGTGEPGKLNWRSISRCIDKFIRLRRYESMSLHEVMQGITLTGPAWLASPSVDKTSKLSNTDFVKRKDLMTELIYYILDSYLIPLLRGCFYITESTANRNELFYFRHDVWQAMIAPSLSSLKDTMMEECSTAATRKMLAKRALGVSHVRLLPKERGMRPIINLRRRVQTLQHGEMVLGKSINSILTPAFSVLNCEKSTHPHLLASALFSVDDIFPRLQAFRNSLRGRGQGHVPLYFGKVDVQACFDTIPQKRLMNLVKTIIGSEEYSVTRYARGKLIGKQDEQTRSFGAKPSWRFLTKASRKVDPFDFAQEAEAEAESLAGRSRCLYVNGVIQKTEHRNAILSLLEEHVEANLVKIDKKVYRQKKGIPQGSIVSTLLCSYIYGELEGEMLSFLNDGQSLMLRLIDDFLVISTSQEQVGRFMTVMHKGIPQFGVQVKIDKSRVNFDFVVDDKLIPRVPDVADFPYCGYTINTRSLDVGKDVDRRRVTNIADSITVEYSRLPGQAFYRKTLNALKLQMHAMLLETSYNSLQTVLSNLYHCFTEVAQKSYHYLRSLPTSKQPGDRLMIRTVDDTIKLAISLVRGLKKPSKDIRPRECTVSSDQTRWIACSAIIAVFRQRQTRHAGLLSWLKMQVESPRLRAQSKLLSPVANRYRRSH